MNLDRWTIFGLGGLLVFGGFVAAFQFVEPPPPTTLTIATGQKGGAYYSFAERYKKRLVREGVRLKILETAGSIANLKLLIDGKADVAFVQGGTRHTVPRRAKLNGLASIYLEPMWIFARRDAGIVTLAHLAGKHIAIGPEGSGTRALAQLLLTDSGLGEPSVRLSALGGAAAIDALLAGTVDALITVIAPQSDAVRKLAARKDIVLVDLPLAPALALRHPFLTLLSLPRGTFDPAADRPPGDVHLLAPAATLVARGDLHPALTMLMLQVARRVHRDGDMFAPAGTFPSEEKMEFRQSPEAQRFFTSGPPLLKRHLPFWIADLIQRLMILLLPLLALLLPLVRVLPPVYQWRVRSRVFRMYKDLKAIEIAAHEGPDGDREALHRRLDAMEDDVVSLKVPLSYQQEAYALRSHIDYVRRKLDGAAGG